MVADSTPVGIGSGSGNDRTTPVGIDTTPLSETIGKGIPSEGNPKKDTQDAREEPFVEKIVCVPVESSEDDGKREFHRKVPPGVPIPRQKVSVFEDVPLGFDVFRDALEDWWCKMQNIVTLPPDMVTYTQIEWLFSNKFSLNDIQGFYAFATTDPSQKWRQGSVTLGAIVKGIAGWKAKPKPEASKPVDFSHCGQCDPSTGLKSTVINGVSTMVKCKHRAKEAVAA